MANRIKHFLNFLLIIFIMTFVINCAEENKNNNKDAKSETAAAVKTADTSKMSEINTDPSARRIDESPEDYQLRIAGVNNVKKRSTINYLYDLNGNLMEEGGLAEEVEFDPKGRRVTHVIYRGLNKINNTWEFKYDEKDNLIEFESYDRFDALQLRKNLTYNKDNKVTETKEFFPTKGNEITTKYVYNDEGLLLKKIGTNSKGEVSSEINEYNSQWKLVKLLMTGENGSVNAEERMEYDSEGKLVKEILKYPDRPELYTTYSNYIRGFACEIVTPIQKKIFELDENGNVMVDIMFNSKGGRQHKYINEYDEKGLMIKKTRYDAKDKPALVIKYEYEYYK